MIRFSYLLLLIFIAGCAAPQPRFVKEKACSRVSLKYLKNPRNRFKQLLNNPELTHKLAETQKSMQLCYEDFKNRTGVEEFNTCLVVGVDYFGNLDFYNFSTEEVRVDQAFMKCARAVTESVKYPEYGRNFILVQSYQFYTN